MVDILFCGDRLLAVSLGPSSYRLVRAALAALDRELDVLRVLGMLSVWWCQLADFAMAGHGSVARVLLSAGTLDAHHRRRAHRREPCGILWHLFHAGIPRESCTEPAGGARPDIDVLR